MGLSLNDHQLRFLASHPAWMAMSWEARGMAMHLMSFGDHDAFLGTIPGEDHVWRAALGFPSSQVLSQQFRQTIQGRGSKEQHSLDVVWNDVWKPELLGWFVIIDETFVDNNPRFDGCQGRCWHPLLDVWMDTEVPKARKTNTKQGSGVSTQVHVSKAPARPKTGKSAGRVGVLKAPKKLPVDGAWDYPVPKLSMNALNKCWDIPLPQAARSHLWETALSLLTSETSGKANARARTYLGGLIKDFGERAVAQAVAQLAVRPQRPADPAAFLRKMLIDERDGSVAVRKARSARVKVPL